MGVQHTQTSIKNKPKTREELTAENAALTAEIAGLQNDKANLETQVTDLQIALCDVYELMAAGTGV